MQASCESCALSLTTPQNGQTVDFIFVTRAPSQGYAVELQKSFHARFSAHISEHGADSLFERCDSIVQFTHASAAIHAPVVQKDRNRAACEQG